MASVIAFVFASVFASVPVVLFCFFLYFVFISLHFSILPIIS